MERIISDILLFIFLFLGHFFCHSQCNGTNELCDRKYNDVAYLTTHNSYNCSVNGFLFPNQNAPITDQLNNGVRALMLDVYAANGSLTVYHGTQIVGSQPLAEILYELKTFLDSNPTEVVTLILECYVSSSEIENALVDSDLLPFCYAKLPLEPWPSLQEMIDMNKRLVVFTDVNDASTVQNWYHYVWDFAVETDFNVHQPNQFTNAFNRGNPTNDLFIFNHFITDATWGIGNVNEAALVNDSAFLMSRIIENYTAVHKFPNFITLDFYDVGDGKELVDLLNQSVLTVEEHSIATEISLFPNPVGNQLSLKLRPIQGAQVVITDLLNMPVVDCAIYSDLTLISVGHLTAGSYLLNVFDKNHELLFTRHFIKL